MWVYVSPVIFSCGCGSLNYCMPFLHCESIWMAFETPGSFSSGCGFFVIALFSQIYIIGVLGMYWKGISINEFAFEKV